MLVADPDTYAMLDALPPSRVDRLLDRVHCRRAGQRVTTGATVARDDIEERAQLIALRKRGGDNAET